MGDRTGIEWTDATWNPMTGCTKISTGCDHCYAATVAETKTRDVYLRQLPVKDTPASTAATSTAKSAEPSTKPATADAPASPTAAAAERPDPARPAAPRADPPPPDSAPRPAGNPADHEDRDENQNEE